MSACLIYYCPMNALTLTQTTPLFEDKDGTIRIVGSRIPLDTIVYEFNQGQLQNKFRIVSHFCHSAVFTEPLLSTWNTRPPLRSIFATESKKPQRCGVNLRAVLKSQHCVKVSAIVGRS